MRKSKTPGLLTPEESYRRYVAYLSDERQGIRKTASSGISSLDQILDGGFAPGRLYILGARPAMGKTTLAVGFLLHLCRNAPCLYVAPAASPNQVMRPLHLQFIGRDKANLESRLEAVMDIMRPVLYNHNKPTVQQIRSVAQGIPGLRAVIIDYMELIRQSEGGGSSYKKTLELCRELKWMALELEIPVICLCQLSRAVEKRVDKRPLLSDLNGDGAIEEIADVVMLLYRDDYYNPISKEMPYARCIVAKNRHGRNGSVDLRFLPDYLEYGEIIRR